ncbi:helix-turn-helix transcriptional regulator [Streptomyces sp. ACA25]|uniref:helix-turn-helix domain-containing protein n=1 Tax=Streptomyces sp. ACA25 TaxID=3022596 RepID=UPI002306FE1C|nr:helix-turn-helix transcriptional regulator [Streptomyces sp. ACA25]MDB1088591.1 helix-turn-helix transcriptional regulator [Streptomyces sp. ACA25]
MPPGGMPTARSRRLGATLRRLRLAAQLEQEAAARAVDCSVPKISRVESGAVKARVGDVRILLDLYGVTDPDRRRWLEKLARESNKRGWWLDYETNSWTQLGDFISMEADATYIRTWQHAVIPGPLQTPDYTRALLATNPASPPPEAAEEVVRVRQERRQALVEGGIRYAAVIWEPAITTPMPSARVHRDQLTHLLHAADEQTVTVQVLPLHEWAAARVSPAFVAFSFGRDHAPEVVASDTLSNTAMIEDPDEVTNYAHAFDALRSAALTPNDTTAFLEQARAQLASGDTTP